MLSRRSSGLLHLSDLEFHDWAIMSKQYLCRTLDMVMGPMPLSELRQLIARGLLSPHDELCEVGQAWQRVAELECDVGSEPTSDASKRTQSPVPSKAAIPPFVAPPARERSRVAVASPQEMAVGSIAADASVSASQSHPPQSREMRQLVAEFMQQHGEKTVTTQLDNAEVLARRPPSVVADRICGALLSGTSTVSSVLATIITSKPLWIMAGIVLFITMFPTLKHRYQSEESSFVTVDEVFEEWRSLYEAEVEKSEWLDFQQHAQPRLQALIPILEKRASRDDEKSMSLLWVGRDYLPKLLSQPQAPDPMVISKIETHLATARPSLVPVESGGQTDPWTVTVLVIDAVGILIAVVWWWRRSLSEPSPANQSL